MTVKIKPFQHYGRGYTVFNNEILDFVFPKLSKSEWCVLTFMIRQITGWNKKTDTISYTQFLDNTPVNSKATLSKALNRLEKIGIVIRHERTDMTDIRSYSLNLEFEMEI